MMSKRRLKFGFWGWLGGRGLSCARFWVVVVICLGVYGVSGVALGDAVKLSGFWIEDVIVDQITDGQVLYVSASGSEVSRPIGDLEGLRLTAYPGLDRAAGWVDAGELGKARPLYEKVRHRAKEGWIRHWASHGLLGVYDGLGEPTRMVDELVRLARGGAPVRYLTGVGIGSIEGASQKVREDVVRRLVSAVKSLRRRPGGAAIGEVLERVRALAPVDVAGGVPSEVPVKVPSEVPVKAPSKVPDKAASQAADKAAGAGGGAGSGVVLPGSIDRSDQAVRMLLSGESGLAVQAAERSLERGRGNVAMYLYLRGMGLLVSAERGGDRGLYLDAGLSFMRVIVGYPTSVYAGPSLVELGFVHDKIGRSDRAGEMYGKALGALDVDEDPGYVSRLRRLREASGR